MIIDKTDDVLQHWEESERHLLIMARPGNGKTSKAKDIMNQMIAEDRSILLLTSDKNPWKFGLNKSSKMLIAPCEYISGPPFHIVETDMLVIHDLREIDSEFPIENIRFKYILALSDDSANIPAFFSNGKIIRLIDWNNVTKLVIEEKKMYKAFSSDEEGTILLSEWSIDHETQVSIKFPIETLKKLLLE